LLSGKRSRPILRPATIIAEGDQQRPALGGTFGGAAVEVLQVVAHTLESVALLVDLPGESTTLGRRIAENREEARAFTANAARLCDQPIDFKLLPIDHVLRAVDLVGTCRVGIAAINRGQLRFKPLAGGIGRLRQRRGDARDNDSCGGKAIE
jgi:hypothetical protein